MAADAPYNRRAKGAKPRSSSVGQPSASTATPSQPPTFEVIGDLSDEAIEALAALLLSIHEDKKEEASNERLDAMMEVGQ